MTSHSERTTVLDVTNSRHTTSSQPVSMFRDGQHILIKLPHACDLLLQHLHTTQHESIDDSDHGYRVAKKRVPLVQRCYDMFGTEHWRCFAGLEQVVIRLLRQAGYEVSIRGLRVVELDDPRTRDQHVEIDTDIEWLRRIQTSDRFLCRYNSASVQPEWLVAQAAFAWPDKSIMVWTKSLSETKEFARRLNIIGVTAFWDNGHREPYGRPQVRVATTGYFSRDTSVQTCEIGFVLDARAVAREAGIEATRYAFMARLYGLLDENVHVNRFDDDLMAAIFGFDRLLIPQHGQVAATPDVVEVPFRGGVELQSDASQLETQRRAIWHNKGRNAFVAKLARDTSRNECTDESLTTHLEERFGAELPTVAVMVANVEHLLALARMLPAATLLTGDHINLDSLTQRNRRRLDRSEALDERLFIVTPLARNRIEGIDVVSNAVGGGDIQEVNVYQNDQPLLIDIRDRHHGLLRRWSDRRRQLYVELGCNLVGITVTDPVDAFIESRGKNKQPQTVRLGGDAMKSITSAGYESPRRDFMPRDAGYFYRERQRRRAERNHAENGPPHQKPLVFAEVFGSENLIACYKHLRAENGPSPGVDGITYADLNPSEVAQIARHVSEVIHEGTYKPHETRRVDIPKQNGSDFRTLQLGVVFDRVVSKALNNALTPYWEEVFLDGSWGFRPERGYMQMLAEIEATMIKTGNYVIAIDDIRNAFDNVSIDHTITAHDQLLTSTLAPNGTHADNIAKLLTLIETVLKGHDQQRVIGIDQGNPYSPTALNALLQLNHDSPLHDNGTLWFRYADNLVYLSHSEDEGLKILGSVREYLKRVNMTLKGEPGTAIDLMKGHQAEILGTIVRLEEDNLAYSTGSEAWTKLNSCLARAWESTVPQRTALAGVGGWVDSFGMTFESSGDLICQVHEHASEFGFRELNTQDLENRWHASCVRWQECRRKAFQKHGIQE